MSVFTMVVLIVLIVTIGRIYESQKKARLQSPLSGENRRLEAEVTRLNERIAVLERLATDPSKRLSDEIESLKSLPAQENDDAQR